MKKIIRAYRADGSATTDPQEIKDLLKSTEDIEIDYDLGRGVKAGTLDAIRGETVLIGKDEVEVV